MITCANISLQRKLHKQKNKDHIFTYLFNYYLLFNDEFVYILELPVSGMRKTEKRKRA